MNKPRRELASSPQPYLMLAVTIAALYFAREIFIPLAFALTLSLAMTPAIQFLQRLRCPRVLAILLVMCAGLGAVGVLGYIIGNQLVEVANELPYYRENIHRKIEAIRKPGSNSLARAAENVKELRKELATTDPEPATPAPDKPAVRRRQPLAPPGPVDVRVVGEPPNGLQSLEDLISPVLPPIAMAGIVIIFTAFLLLHREDLRNRLLRLAGLSQINLMTTAFDDGAKRIGRYLLLQFLVNACFGLAVGGLLYLLQLPYAALWGTVAGVLRIVPYVGTMVGAALPALVALAMSDSWEKPALFLGIFAVVEIITGNVIEPWLFAAHTGTTSLALLVTTVFWTILWGPYGLILSTPLTVSVVVLGRYVPQLWFLHILLGDEPVLSPSAQLYQRLLAMDAVESREILDQQLKERTMPEVFDMVVAPALTMAEQDRHRGDLSSEREEFLYLSLSELVSDLPSETAEERKSGAPTVYSIPAHDLADEVAAAMLAQLLDHAGFRTAQVPLQPAGQLLASLHPAPHDILFVSTIPPFALGRARAVCRQLHSQFPDSPLMVGAWGYAGDVGTALRRFEAFRPDKLFTSFETTLEYMARTATETTSG